MHTYDCIIVGAGISGLSAAYELSRRGADLLLVEARDEPGGSMRSEHAAEGFVLENGPNTVVSSDPAMDQHFADLGIAEQRIVADRRGARRYVLLNGQLELIPTSPGAFFQSPLLSTSGKLRLLAEPLLPPAATPDESVATFFTRRLGSELANHLIDPFVSGVYAGNPRELSIQSTFPSLWEAEQTHGSVVRGMLLGRKKKRSGPRKRSEMISFRDGLLTWPRAIAQALGPEHTLFGARATALRPDAADGWHVRVVREGREEMYAARKVVLAVPSHVAATLLADLDATAAAALRGISHPPMAVVHLGYRRADVEHPLDGFGMLCPSREGRDVLGTLWPSSLFEGRAPEGMVLTSSFVGGARLPHLAQLDDEELIERVATEQRSLIGARGEPAFARVAHWDHAIAQYNAGHAHRMEVLAQTEAARPGLHLLGNYRDGVSVEKCWHKGRDLGLNLPLGQPRSIERSA
jgi:oxygen-dependent protoporphyrinogen oxidase